MNHTRYQSIPVNQDHFAIGCRVAFFAFTLLFCNSAWPVMAAEELVGNAQNAIGEFSVVRTDGIEERLEGKGTLPLYEGDILRTGVAETLEVRTTQEHDYTARIVPDNPFAFPPSMAVRCRS